MRNASRAVFAILVLVAILGSACTTSPTVAGTPSSAGTTASAPPTPAGSPTKASSTPTPPPVHLAQGITLHVARPSGLVAGFGALWAQSRLDDTLLKISPTGQVLARIPHVSKSPPHAGMDYNQGYVSLAAGFGFIWSVVPGAILRIDPTSASVAERIRVPIRGYVATLAVGLGALWVTDYSARLFRIDPQSGAVTVASRGVLASPSGLAITGGFLWIPEISEAGGIMRFDPETGHLRRFVGNAYASFVAGTPSAVWLGYRSGQIGMIDAVTGHLRPGPRLHPQLEAIGGITTGLNRIFVNAGSLVVIDPSSGEARVLPGVSTPQRLLEAGIAVLGGRVWMADPSRNEIRGIAVCALTEC